MPEQLTHSKNRAGRDKKKHPDPNKAERERNERKEKKPFKDATRAEHERIHKEKIDDQSKSAILKMEQRKVEVSNDVKRIEKQNQKQYQKLMTSDEIKQRCAEIDLNRKMGLYKTIEEEGEEEQY